MAVKQNGVAKTSRWANKDYVVIEAYSGPMPSYGQVEKKNQMDLSQEPPADGSRWVFRVNAGVDKIVLALQKPADEAGPLSGEAGSSSQQPPSTLAYLHSPCGLSPI